MSNSHQMVIVASAIDSPKAFQEVIFIIESGLMRQLALAFPPTSADLGRVISGNVETALIRSSMRLCSLQKDPEALLMLSNLIRLRVDKVFFELFYGDSVVTKKAFI